MTSLIDRLRRLATWLCTPVSIERRIEPTLADLRNEYLDAISRGSHWKSRWVQATGCLIVLKVVSLVTLERTLRSVTHLDARTRTALLESAGIFAIVVALATVVIIAPVLSRTLVERPPTAHEALYLVPAALPLAIPLGLIPALILGVRERLSSQVRNLVLVWALCCSMLSFANLAWLVPAANQAYRTSLLGIGIEPGKGPNELTLREIARHIESTPVSGPGAPLRHYLVSYHVRWAYSLAPLAVALFALALTRRVRHLLPMAAVTLVACCGWTLLVMVGSVFARGGQLTPMLGAWLPNAVFISAALAMRWTWRPTRVASD
jgi:hypothetical protein